MVENSEYLYRIMQYHHVVQLFTTRKLYFSHPSRWDDPYEVRVKHAWDKMLFAQCWCKRSMSDAMWRIFSQNLTSVRIRTTRRKLSDAMRVFCSSNPGYLRRVQEVDYFHTNKLNKRTQELAVKLRESKGKPALTTAADILCLKRSAFDHEAEVRALLYCPQEASAVANLGICIEIDPHDFVETIVIDPRASDEIAETFRYYFKNVLNFEGSIERSALYKAPEYIAVDLAKASLDDDLYSELFGDTSAALSDVDQITRMG